MDIFYFQNKPEGASFSYLLAQDNLGPFDLPDESLKEILSSSSTWNLIFKVTIDLPSYARPESACFEWTIYQKYDFIERGQVKVTLDIQK
jgi:hypothetical protein